MVFKARITAKQFGRLTPEKLVSRIALQEGGIAANALIEARMTGPNKAADGRPIALKRVKTYKTRAPWVKATEVRQIAEVTSPRREAIGRVKEARDDKRYGDAEGHTPSSVPPVIFQQLRAMGGVFRSLASYEGGRLKGGTPVECKRPQTWQGRNWSQGDVWGFHWPSRAAFLADQGKGEAVKMGGAGSRIWMAATAKVQASGRNLKLVLGFTGRATGDATQVLADTRSKTAGGKARKASPAQIAALANARDKDGRIGAPASTGGRPHGGSARLTGHLPEAAAVRWHALSREELARTVIAAMDAHAMEAIRRLPQEVTIVEAGKTRTGSVVFTRGGGAVFFRRGVKFKVR